MCYTGLVLSLEATLVASRAELVLLKTGGWIKGGNGVSVGSTAVWNPLHKEGGRTVYAGRGGRYRLAGTDCYVL